MLCCCSSLIGFILSNKVKEAPGKGLLVQGTCAQDLVCSATCYPHRPRECLNSYENSMLSLLILNFNVVLIAFSLGFGPVNFVYIDFFSLPFLFRYFAITGDYFIKLKIFYNKNSPSACLTYIFVTNFL
jgi:hypothetical protein